MEIYIVLESDVSIDDDINKTEIYAFDSIEDANNKVRELKQNFIDDVDIDDFIVDDNTDEEESLCSFSAYEDGEYNNNHYEVIVYQREIG